jgi:hypothetical protein
MKRLWSCNSWPQRISGRILLTLALVATVLESNVQ